VTRVILIDDHELVRLGIAHILNRDLVCEIVYESDLPSAEKLAELKPDVAILDIDVPGQDMFAVGRSIKSLKKDTKLIYLSAYFTDNFFEEVNGAGADAYILKTSDTISLVDGVRCVVEGRMFVCPNIRRLLPPDYRLGADFKSKVHDLTDREREVLALLAKGLNVKEIATKLDISHRTVDRHKSNIMDKLQIHSQVKLAWFAIVEGIVNPFVPQNRKLW